MGGAVVGLGPPVGGGAGAAVVEVTGEVDVVLVSEPLSERFTRTPIAKATARAATATAAMATVRAVLLPLSGGGVS
ncbi:hypothetical protein [Nocardia sp. IFM 10818]